MKTRGLQPSSCVLTHPYSCVSCGKDSPGHATSEPLGLAPPPFWGFLCPLIF